MLVLDMKPLMHIWLKWTTISVFLFKENQPWSCFMSCTLVCRAFTISTYYFLNYWVKHLCVSFHVNGSKKWKLLIQSSGRSFIFSTSTPVPVAAAAHGLFLKFNLANNRHLVYIFCGAIYYDMRRACLQCVDLHFSLHI